MKIGIQGGLGSFNEEAIKYYTKREGISNFETVYLHTTKNVLKALEKGKIDYGQFAIHNSTGGLVIETIEELGNYKFKLINHYGIKIEHTLMIKKGLKLKDIDTIMTHPQVLKQCKENLANKYPNLKLTSGEGVLIDHAEVAKSLSENKLPDNIGVIASKVLAEIYNLEIVEIGLQDLKNNFTSFMYIGR